ncbi:MULTISPECIES: phasin family protein [Bradyrhizobium]|uniref:Phasin family protein n=1 Tax=Bradyrhizobium vignae TaxID=1549949 RepID=A0ABS4A7T9_9BRAD|nr:phasin family protein [Bradyrhizobium vignae]MBP0116495.1 phasin family protein [Bradyrhizobium vignae]RXG83646.1 phasin family protein [Bradyrhizobium vignae]
MTNPRPEEKPTQSPEDTIRRAGERTAEQTRRIGLATAEAGEEVAQASGHLLRQNTEMLQNAWRFGLDMAAAMMGRSTDQLGRTFGLSGNEAQQAAERSVRNAEAIMYSTTAVAKGMNGASREYFDFMRQQIERNMDRMNELWSCRTPHDLAAVQTDLMRDTIKSALDTHRRMADLSLKVADDAGNHITQSIERMRQAA